MSFAAIWAELEADTIQERVTNGLTAARARGQKFGRTYRFTAELKNEIAAALASGTTARAIARKHKTSDRTIQGARDRAAARI